MNKYCIVMVMVLVTQVMHGMELIVQEQPNNFRCQNDPEQRLESVKVAISKMTFNGNEQIINIGCDDKRITDAIRSKVPNGLVKDVNFSTMQFVYSFDRAIAFGSLEWFKDHRKAFTRIAASLYAGGKIFLGVAHEDSAYLRARYKMQTHNRWQKFLKDYEIPYYPSSEAKIEELLGDVGCKLLSLRKGNGINICKSRQECINFIRNFPIQKERIPSDMREDFFNDIIDEYIKEIPFKDDGSIELIIPSINVVAERINPLMLVLKDVYY